MRTPISRVRRVTSWARAPTRPIATSAPAPTAKPARRRETKRRSATAASTISSPDTRPATGTSGSWAATAPRSAAAASAGRPGARTATAIAVVVTCACGTYACSRGRSARPWWRTSPTTPTTSRPRAVRPAELEPMAERVRPRPEAARERQVHEHDRRRLAGVAPVEVAASDERDLHRAPIAGCHRVEVGRGVLVRVRGFLALDVDAPHVEVPAERDLARGAGRRHAGSRRERPGEALVEAGRPLPVGVGHVHLGGDEAARLEARLHVEQPAQALDREDGPDEEDRRDRHLAGQQQALPALAGGAGAVARALAEPLLRVGRRGTQGRESAEREAARDRTRRGRTRGRRRRRAPARAAAPTPAPASGGARRPTRRRARPGRRRGGRRGGSRRARARRGGPGWRRAPPAAPRPAGARARARGAARRGSRTRGRAGRRRPRRRPRAPGATRRSGAPSAASRSCRRSRSRDGCSRAIWRITADSSCSAASRETPGRSRPRTHRWRQHRQACGSVAS